MPSPLDRFIPTPDVRERFQTTIAAPAAMVLDVACNFDLQSLFGVRLIFWLREKLLRASSAPRKPQGLVSEMRGIGWNLLAEEPGRFLVFGAVTQPWKADVVFRPLPAEELAEYAEPNQVKIAWSPAPVSAPGGTL